MSLQVWLPLNGNLNNQGLSNVNITNSGVIINDNGKIGKCYQFDSSKKLSFPSFTWMEMKPSNNFSVFMWVKGTTTGWLVACGAWELRLRSDYIQVHLGGSGAYPAKYTASFDTNVWYHLGFTWSGSDGLLKLYLNGELKATSEVPSSASYNISTTYNTVYDGTRYLNDYRIYDHCLSAKEVKEISKGLVLHYKLDDNGFGNSNLVSTLVAGGQTVLDGKYSLHTTNVNADTYFYAQLSESVNNGDVVTVSCDVSGLPSGAYWDFPFWSQSSGLTWNLRNGHNEGTFTCTGTSSKIIFDDNKVSGFTRGAYPIKITNFKLERGSKATPWCPNKADTLYSQLGLDSNIEQDCSGYNYNGIKTIPPKSNSNTIRYIQSSQFNSNDKTNITIEHKIARPEKDFTISIWGYKDNWNTSSAERLAGRATGGGWCFGDYGTENALFACYVNSSYNTASGFKQLSSGWHHLSITFDGKNLIYYLDGVEYSKKTFSTETKVTYSDGFVYIGSHINSLYWFNGLLSDFRIYTTALSADDIKELYQSSASIDKNGNVYSYELKEE